MLIRLALALALCALPATAQLTGTVTQVGPGCGPNLDASFSRNGNHNRLTLTVTNAFPHEHVAAIWGFAPLYVPFPNGCILYNDFHWGTTDMTDGNGSNTFARSWPNSIPGFFRIQYVSLRTDPNHVLEFQLSNAVLVENQ